jgi:hypothetical protein
MKILFVLIHFLKQLTKHFFVWFVRETTIVLSRKLEEEISEAITSRINNSVRILESAIKDGEKVIQEYQRVEINSTWMMFGAIFIFAIICVLVVCKFFVGTPVVKFNDKQAMTYQEGKKLEAVWNDELTIKEQMRINDLYFGYK